MPVTDTGGRTGYVFDNDNAHSGGQHRFLASAHDPMTTARLAETGVGAGWRCLEVGAGGGSVAVWLAGRVAPTGSVLATDVKPQRIPRRPGLTVVRHDVTSDPLPESEFDLVVARLVLRHLPQRLEVLDRLVRALKPGGRLQIDEFDTSYEPPLVTPDERSRRVYEDFIAAKDAVMRAAGVDPAFGRHVAAAMRDAGLADIDPRPFIQLRRAGSADLEQLVNHTFHLRDALVAAGMTDERLAEVRSAMRDPSFLAASSVMYSVHGTRPLDGAF
ncbi:methyltransferase family protein [Saccharopolyspora erythraea NRRL 2338]|uniref:Methyltransferase n=2 Tax=Saccharopolyspora erythraea TaxID=1836 RepID=A4FEL7_SACEN|nr:methyltransferase domain-containing protein [Saccharopolyspora erythraea]EQD83538.1 SAM-dependent methyltransferase [Saccharopolyspora erythraea D]PFG96217.1 methyltransferase family protein [Saccharopolyspora erythraea NRRL 2338]QRK92744.1 methyltransferase domain-containing protein [Saccharopolyspora erythraea]CAM02492.1 methyltransferase [Saccharopolyspora erythraea NRRL 2338]